MPVPEARTSRLLVVLFVVYLVLLAWVILWKLELPYVGAAAGLPRPWKLVPFVADSNSDASAPLEVIANVLFFVPFGFFLGLLAPLWAWWKAGSIILLSSLLLETVQHLLSIGTFDTSDVISNTAGGLLGLVLLALARRRLTVRVLVRSCLVFTAIAVVAAVVFIASPLHYSQPHDVVVPLPTPSP